MLFFHLPNNNQIFFGWYKLNQRLLSLARPALGEERFSKICQCVQTATKLFTDGSMQVTQALLLAEVSEHRKTNSTAEENDIDEALVKNAKLPIRDLLVHGCSAINMGLDSKECMQQAFSSLLEPFGFQEEDLFGQLMQAHRKIVASVHNYHELKAKAKKKNKKQKDKAKSELRAKLRQHGLSICTEGAPVGPATLNSEIGSGRARRGQCTTGVAEQVFGLRGILSEDDYLYTSGTDQASDLCRHCPKIDFSLGTGSYNSQ